MNTHNPEMAEMVDDLAQKEDSRLRRTWINQNALRLAKMPRSIVAGLKGDPGSYAIIAGSLLVAGGTILYSILQKDNPGNYDIANSRGNNVESSKVNYPDRDGDTIRQELGYFGDVISTGPLGIRIIEREGVNKRMFPDRELGIKVGAYQAYEYHPEEINVSHLIRTRDNNLWAVSWGEPDQDNEGLRPMELFVVKDKEQWYVDFVFRGQVMRGEELFGHFADYPQPTEISK